MRSVPSGSFTRLISSSSLWAAWKECRRGKRRQPRIAAWDLDADTHICRLHRQLREGTFRPSPYRLKVVHDPKTRLVAAPALEDRVVQQALLAEIGPTYERGFIDHRYACCRGRGAHRAVLAFLGWLRRHPFRLSLDVRRYFPSIDHEILLNLFARRLRSRDRGTVELIESFLTAGGEVYRTPLARQVLGLDEDPVPEGCGLPLGSYLSHWSGGLYLDGLDHFVKRELKVRGYLRYMDDLALFGEDARELEEHREAIREWLRQERKLELKDRRDQVLPSTQPATYIGFRISRAGVAPGPKMKRRLRQRLLAAGSTSPAHLARSLQSYRGLLLSL